MLAGNLVLMMFEVTLFAEVGLLSEAVMRGHDVLATLANHLLNHPTTTLNFYSWALVKANWII